MNTPNLLSEEIAQKVIDFYKGRTQKRIVDLLLEQPSLFTDFVKQTGSALLLLELGCIEFVSDSNDFLAIVSAIDEHDWCHYILNCGGLKVTSPRVDTKISRYLKSNYPYLNDHILSMILKKYQNLSTPELREIGQTATHKERRLINIDLSRRGEEKLARLRSSKRKSSPSFENNFKSTDLRSIETNASK